MVKSPRVTRKSSKKAVKSFKVVRKSPKKSVKKSVRKSPKKVVKKSVRKSPKKVVKKSVRKSPKKVVKKSVRKSKTEKKLKTVSKKFKYSMTTQKINLPSDFFGGVLPTDAYVKMFAQADNVKDKIRLLSINRAIRDAIYDAYGGENAVNEMIRVEKKAVVVKNLLDLMEENKDDPTGIDFDYVREMMEEYGIHPDELRTGSGKTIFMLIAKANREKDAMNLFRYIWQTYPAFETLDNQDNEGNTALIYVSMQDYSDVRTRGTPPFEEIATALIKGGVDLDIQNNEGKTALMYACMMDNEPIFYELIKSSQLLDVNIEDNEGNTAVEYARDIVMLDELEGIGADEDRIEDARNELRDQY